MSTLSDSTKITLPVKALVALVGSVVVGALTGYSMLWRTQANQEKQLLMIEVAYKKVEEVRAENAAAVERMARVESEHEVVNDRRLTGLEVNFKDGAKDRQELRVLVTQTQEQVKAATKVLERNNDLLEKLLERMAK